MKHNCRMLVFIILISISGSNTESSDIEVNDIEDEEFNKDDEEFSHHNREEWNHEEHNDENYDPHELNDHDESLSVLDGILESIHLDKNENENNIIEDLKLISVASMKESLRKAGVNEAKLNNFLDRESLYEYYLQYDFQSNAEIIKPSTPPKISRIKNKTELRAADLQRRAKLSGEITQVVLAGGRHSGIGWVASLLHLNAPAWKLVKPFDRHALVQTTTAKPLIEPSKINNTLILLVVQDPFTWIASMHERHPHGAVTFPKKRTNPITNPKHHGYKKQKRSSRSKVTSNHVESLETYVRSGWRDDDGLEFSSISAMRTAKASALIRAAEGLRFGIIRSEDLIQDSEVAMRSVLTSLQVNIPWRDHHWKERQPYEQEWFDLDDPSEPWHKPASYYLTPSKVLAQYSPKAAHAVIKYLDVKLEKRSGYLPHPLIGKSREEVDEYFHSQTLGLRLLSSISKISAKIGALLVAAPLGLLALFLPLAASYGAWLRFRHEKDDEKDDADDAQLPSESHHDLSQEGFTYNQEGQEEEVMAEKDETLYMENTITRKQMLQKKKKESHGRFEQNMTAASYNDLMNSATMVPSSLSSLPTFDNYFPNNIDSTRLTLKEKARKRLEKEQELLKAKSIGVDDLEDDYTPTDYDGGGYFELYGDLSMGQKT